MRSFAIVHVFKISSCRVLLVFPGFCFFFTLLTLIDLKYDSIDKQTNLQKKKKKKDIDNKMYILKIFTKVRYIVLQIILFTHIYALKKA